MRRCLSILFCACLLFSIGISPAAAAAEAQHQTISVNDTEPITPWDYQKMLGKGMDVDWCKTKQGMECYTSQTADHFAKAGISHVRIRVKDDVDDELLARLDQQVNDCLSRGIIPIIAYQADELKNNPSDKNLRHVADWWKNVAEHFRDTSYLLAFDLIIEVTDALNKQPERLNEIYETLVAAVRETNPKRIVMISPRYRSDPSYLNDLEIPSQANGYLMAEWHFYAAGPSKSNERKKWTTGTPEERQAIIDKVNLALAWQEQTNIATWVGAWMPGNYNDGNEYSVSEQTVFASFLTETLSEAGIPFAVNADTHFYDRENQIWIAEMEPVFQAIFGTAERDPALDDESLQRTPVLTDLTVTKGKIALQTNVKKSKYASVGIRVYRSVNGQSFAESDTITYRKTDHGYWVCADYPVKNGTQYRYKIACTYQGEDILTSKSVTAYYLSPVTVKATKIRGGITKLSWNANTKADGYLVQYWETGKKTATKKNIWVHTNKTTTKTISRLSSRKSYSVRVSPYKKSNGVYYYAPYESIRLSR